MKKTPIIEEIAEMVRKLPKDKFEHILSFVIESGKSLDPVAFTLIVQEAISEKLVVSAVENGIIVVPVINLSAIPLVLLGTRVSMVQRRGLSILKLLH